MTLLDAYAVIAHAADEPAAGEVDDLLRDRLDRPVISAANVAEVVDRLARVAGLDLGDVLERVLLLRNGGLEVLSVDAFDGAAAGAFRQNLYHRRDRPLSLGDCLALVSALRYGHRLATADPALASAAREIGVDVVPLPDTDGRRP